MPGEGLDYWILDSLLSHDLLIVLLSKPYLRRAFSCCSWAQQSFTMFTPQRFITFIWLRPARFKFVSELRSLWNRLKIRDQPCAHDSIAFFISLIITLGKSWRRWFFPWCDTDGSWTFTLCWIKIILITSSSGPLLRGGCVLVSVQNNFSFSEF